MYPNTVLWLFLTTATRSVKAQTGDVPVKTTGPVDSLLLRLQTEYKSPSSSEQGADENILDSGFLQIHDGHVVIDAVASGNADKLLDDLKGMGMKNGSVYGAYVSGLFPISAIGDLDALNTLKIVRPSCVKSSAGLTTSQGVQSMRADDVQALGITGKNVWVGVISDTFDNSNLPLKTDAATDIANGDLPKNVLILDDSFGPGTDEGRAMMQIIYDVAPGTGLSFHTASGGFADFALGIEELAGCPTGSAPGCVPSPNPAHVIVDDVIYFVEAMFQDDIIAQAVDNVYKSGRTYFSSAGNQARQSYESTYRSSGIPGISGGIRHNFATEHGVIDDLQTIEVPIGTIVTFSFQWSEPFFSICGSSCCPDGSRSDMDILFYDMAGNWLRSRSLGGTSDNIGRDAVEIFRVFNIGDIDADGDGNPDTQFQIGLELLAGREPKFMKYVYFGDMTISEYDTSSGSIYGHAFAMGAEAVGAAYYRESPPFESPPLIGPFSSAGPAEPKIKFFDAQTCELEWIPRRKKPEIVAPDGVDTTFFSPGFDPDNTGFPNFFGTSAAAPHAAGVAALIKEAYPYFHPKTVYWLLEQTAIDMDDPDTPDFDKGFDAISGYGLIDGAAAIEKLCDILGRNSTETAIDTTVDIKTSICPNSPPVAKCKNVTGQVGAGCFAGADIDASSYDPDGDSFTLEQNPEGPYPLGPTLVTLTATDDKNASSTCTGIVTMVDETKPILNCPEDISLNASNYNCTATVPMDFINGASSTDDCDPDPSITSSLEVGDLLLLGWRNVTFTAEDNSGNAASCTAKIQVLDINIPPVAIGFPNSSHIEVTKCKESLNQTFSFESPEEDQITTVYVIDVDDAQKKGLEINSTSGNIAKVSMLWEKLEQGYNGLYFFLFNATDGSKGCHKETLQKLSIGINCRALQPPGIGANSINVSTPEGTAATNTGSYATTDVNGVNISSTIGSVTDGGDGTWSWENDAPDGPDDYSVTITAKDSNGQATTVFQVFVINVPPAIEELMPLTMMPVHVDDQPIDFEVAFSDPGLADVHDATWDWGDDSVDVQKDIISPNVGSHDYSEPGSYPVTVTVADNDGGTDSDTFDCIVIYDCGKVKGKGSITSPLGALRRQPNARGKGSFDVDAKYKKGRSVPTGKMQYELKDGKKRLFRFDSKDLEWLVINAQEQAQLMGYGVIYRDSGDYRFMASITDESFGIKVWSESNNVETIIYMTETNVPFSGKVGIDEDYGCTSKSKKKTKKTKGTKKSSKKDKKKKKHKVSRKGKLRKNLFRHPSN